MSEEARGRSAEAALTVRRWAEVILKRRWVVFSVIAIVVTVVTLGSLIMTPVYLATATLQIEKGVPRILPFDEVRPTDYPGSLSSEFYQTQYKLLQSRTVARRASLGLDLRNDPQVRRAVAAEEAGGDDPEKPYIDYILAHLRVEPLRNTHIVQVTFLTHDAGLSARLANAVAEAYIRFVTESKSRTTNEARGLIGGQIQALKEEISRLEDDLGRVGQETEIVSMEDREDFTAQKLEMLNSDYVAAQVDRSRKEARYRSLLTAHVDSLPQVTSDPVLQALRQKAAELERRVAEMTSSFKPEWPEMRRLRAELESTQQRIAEETASVARKAIEAAEAEYRQTLDHERTVAAALEDQKEESIERRKRSARYSNMQAAVTSKRNLLVTLLQREGETRSLSGLEDDLRSNAWVVDRAEPPDRPYRPNVPLNVLLSLVSGMSLGVMMAILVERLDSTVKTAADAEQCVDVPVLGTVPEVLLPPRRLRLVGSDAAEGEPPVAVDLASHRDSHSSVAESFREVRTALLFSTADHPPRHLLVSSGQPLEGKSSTSLNLAVSLAQLGRKVLLVDTDLRRPRLHKALELPASPGISSYLSGNAAFEGLVQPTEVPNLFLMASGPLPPNPAELLNSKRFDELRDLLTAGAGFEHVVYDSSPILSVADATILAGRVEGTLLVVRAGQTARESVVRSLERLRQVNARVVGVVVNGVSRVRGDYYRYRYYEAPEEAQASPDAQAGRAQRGPA